MKFSFFSKKAKVPQEGKNKAENALTEEEKIKTAYALNLCMVSLSQIVDYNDLDVLHYEYDAILNNLNIEKVIKDDSLLASFVKILDVCHFFILHAKDKEMLKKKQEMRMKRALTNALGGGNVIAIFGSANPWAIAAGALAMIGVAAVNYKSQREQAKLENEIEEWELEKSALEQLHNLRRQLFETAWRLEERFGFPDEYRLSEKQIGIYNDIIQDPDPQNRFERLELVKDYFGAYPIFWYYLGRAALETAEVYRVIEGDKDRPRAIGMGIGYGDSELYEHYVGEAKSALEEFKRLHIGNELMREDLVAASAYLDHAQLCGEDEMDDMLEDVKQAKKIAGTDVDIIQNCAFRFLQLKDFYSSSQGSDSGNAKYCKKEAVFCFKFLLNRDYNPELNGRLLSKLFIDEASAEVPTLDYKILKACIAHKCSFVYQRMFPFNDEEFKKDLDIFLRGNGLRRLAYNYFYGYFWLENAEFFCAINEAKTTQSYAPLRDYRNRLEREKEKNKKKTLLYECLCFGPFAVVTKKVFEEIYKNIIVKKEISELMRTFMGYEKELLNDSFERDWKKFWFGTKTSQFIPNKFSELEKELFIVVDKLVKVCAGDYVEKFKADFGVKIDCSYEFICETKKEPESISTILDMERETESFRVRIQEMLSDGKRFWFPDPHFPYSPILGESLATAEAIDSLKRKRQVAVKTAEKTVKGTREDALSITSEDVDKLGNKGIIIP